MLKVMRKLHSLIEFIEVDSLNSTTEQHEHSVKCTTIISALGIPFLTWKILKGRCIGRLWGQKLIHFLRFRKRCKIFYWQNTKNSLIQNSLGLRLQALWQSIEELRTGRDRYEQQ